MNVPLFAVLHPYYLTSPGIANLVSHASQMTAYIFPLIGYLLRVQNVCCYMNSSSRGEHEKKEEREEHGNREKTERAAVP